MKDIKINVSRETRMVEINKYVLGNDGENLQGNLVFSFIDEFVDGQARLEYQISGNKYYATLEKSGESYQIPILSVITKKGQIDMQLVVTEGTDELEIPIFKSNIFYLTCNASINAEIEQPDEYEQWIDIANTKLNAIDNLDIDINDSIITIIKKDGSIKTENVKGDKGEKGDAGSIKFIIVNEFPTEDIDENAIYMKPNINIEETNTYEEYIYVNGAWELLGNAKVEVDLTDYPTKDEVDDAIAGIDIPIYQFLYINDFRDTNEYPKISEFITNLRKNNQVGLIRFNHTNNNNKSYGFDKFEFVLYNSSEDLSNTKLIGGEYAHFGIPTFRGTWENDIFTLTNITNSFVDDTSKPPACNNSLKYNVNGDYNPAHKKYVDDSIATALGDIETILATLTTIEESE